MATTYTISLTGQGENRNLAHALYGADYFPRAYRNSKESLAAELRLMKEKISCIRQVGGVAVVGEIKAPSRKR